MTHDELLDKIYWHWKIADYLEFHLLSGDFKALRAVVELHKPEEYGGPARCRVDGSHYPCSTIQAIEKELA